MEFSLLKALAASVRGQVASLKKQSKRLHTVSAEVFGQQYSVETCNEAVARANGYRDWREVLSLSNAAGVDRNLPAWHIHARTPAHEQVLRALIECDVEMSEMRSVVVLGNVESAAVVATCLWTEQISARKVPGLIVIDTSLPTIQRTPVGLAAKYLGISDMHQRFRVIDAREPSIPLAITATAREWEKCLFDTLSQADAKRLDESGGRHLFRQLLEVYQRSLRSYAKDEFDFYVVSNTSAAFSILSEGRPVGIPLADEFPSAVYDMERFRERLSPEVQAAATRLHEIISALDDILGSTGILLQHETLHRPTAVLFNADRIESVAIAGVIHQMYYNRFVSERAVRPTLYCSTEHRDQLPNFLQCGMETVIANGETDIHAPIWNSYTTRTPVFVGADRESIRVSGKSASVIVVQEH